VQDLSPDTPSKAADTVRETRQGQPSKAPVKHGFIAWRKFRVQWSKFDPNTDRKTPLYGETAFCRSAEMATASMAFIDVAPKRFRHQRHFALLRPAW
jgi:hypothetical protein